MYAPKLKLTPILSSLWRAKWYELFYTVIWIYLQNCPSHKSSLWVSKQNNSIRMVLTNLLQVILELKHLVPRVLQAWPASISVSIVNQRTRMILQIKNKLVNDSSSIHLPPAIEFVKNTLCISSWIMTILSAPVRMPWMITTGLKALAKPIVSNINKTCTDFDIIAAQFSN